MRGIADRQLSLFDDGTLGGSAATVMDAADVSVRHSSRAKRLSIKVFPRGRVEVVVPRRTRHEDVEAFVAENRTWIANARAAFAEHISPDFYRLPKFVDLTALGRRIAVVYRPERDAVSVRYRERGNTLALSGAVDDEEKCVEALKRWLSATGKKELSPRLRQLATELGLSYRRVQYRLQRTCWGSHSSSGTISLNLCLLFLDPSVVRYLMVHELCHGVHMNHSTRFWALVREHEPSYRRLDKALGDSWTKVPGWIGVY